METCPCGSGNDYKSCCEVFLPITIVVYMLRTQTWLSSVLALPYVVCLSPLKSWVLIECLSRLKGRGAFGPWVGGQR